MKIDVYGMLNWEAHDFIGQSVAILGTKGYGKSNTARVLMEELLDCGVPICVIDIEGEYHTLKDRHDNVVVAGHSLYPDEVDYPLTEDNMRVLAKVSYLNGHSLVLDMSLMDPLQRDYCINEMFGEIWRHAAVKRIPMIVFVEECHNWMPQGKQSPTKDILIKYATEGRKRGLSLVMVGQRSTRIDKDTLTQSDIYFLHRVTHPADLKVYEDMIPRPRRWVKDKVFGLSTGEALVLRGDQVLRHKIRIGHTRHVGCTPTLDDVPKAIQLSFDELLKREQS